MSTSWRRPGQSPVSGTAPPPACAAPTPARSAGPASSRSGQQRRPAARQRRRRTRGPGGGLQGCGWLGRAQRRQVGGERRDRAGSGRARGAVGQCRVEARVGLVPDGARAEPGDQAAACGLVGHHQHPADRRAGQRRGNGVGQQRQDQVRCPAGSASPSVAVSGCQPGLRSTSRLAGRRPTTVAPDKLSTPPTRPARRPRAFSSTPPAPRRWPRPPRLPGVVAERQRRRLRVPGVQAAVLVRRPAGAVDRATASPTWTPARR